jgi:hypothetical protein
LLGKPPLDISMRPPFPAKLTPGRSSDPQANAFSANTESKPYEARMRLRDYKRFAPCTSLMWCS